MKSFINLNVTCEPYEASLLWFVWYIKQCGGVKRIVSTTGGGQESKTVGGMQQLCIKMAEKIGNEKIKLNDPVLKIRYDAELNKTKCCQVTTNSGKEYFAKKIIVALPPINQQKIHFTPALSPMRTQLNQRYPMGTVIKSIIYYNKAFWKDNGCCGSILQLSSDPTKAPLFYTLDDTKPDGSKPALIGFILADRLRALINNTKQERCNMIANSLYKVFNDETALKPAHYEEHTMLNEPYIGGCYTSYAPPGFLTNFGPILRENIDKKIFFAGTETSFNWSGYMNGAIDAGERAAREILVEFGKLKPNEIWVEEPYKSHYRRHEFKDTFYEKYAPSAQGFVNFSLHALALGVIAGIGYLHLKKGGWCECWRK